MSDNCIHCDTLNKKIELYEKLIKDLHEIDKNEKYSITDDGHMKRQKDINLEESMYIDRDNYGNRHIKVRSDLSESFMVIDNGKQLSELSKNELNAIKMQDDLHNYNTAKNYFDRGDDIYSWGCCIFKWGSWLLL